VRASAPATLLFLAAACATPPLAPVAVPEHARWLEVHVVDVGQGDGIWIRTPAGKNIVIDGGPDANDSKNAFLQYLRAHAPSGTLIDALIISHPHDDHYPGAAGVLRHFEVRDLYDPGYPKPGPEWARVLALAAAETTAAGPIRRHAGRGEFGTPDWGSELQVRFLYAWPGDPAGLGSGNTRENNASIVLRIAYGAQSILLMGDAEGKDRDDPPEVPRYVERWLLDSVGGEGLRSTVLKVGHHGSETSSTLPFIAAVAPEIVVVSSGRKAYGGRNLPDRSTLARFCARDPATRIYRTDQDDAAEGRTTATDADGDHIIIRTNGQVTTVEAYSHGRPIVPSACLP
jgi:competence protein ComEC